MRVFFYASPLPTTFHLQRDQRDALKRRVLSLASGLPETELLFEKSGAGKPFLANVDNLHFSISHCDKSAYKAYFVIAVSKAGEIGIDIELIRPRRNLLTIAKKYFSVEETVALAESSVPEALFFELWTKKEAYGKYIGSGLNKEILGRAFTDQDKPNMFSQTIIAPETQERLRLSLYAEDAGVTPPALYITTASI